MNTFLTGAGHFGFGFIAGSILCVLLIVIKKRHLFIQLYAPFLPFLLGFFSALPYAFLFQKTCDLPMFANVFFFYSWAHCSPFIVGFLGNLHLVMVVCGLVYGLIILRYIILVKRVRRYGWR